jgi:hypothetical protein
LAQANTHRVMLSESNTKAVNIDILPCKKPKKVKKTKKTSDLKEENQTEKVITKKVQAMA